MHPVEYDSSIVSYRQLLDIYWSNIDPTQADGQFVDRGSQYRTVVFYRDHDEQEQAEASRLALQQSGRFDSPIVVAIEPVSRFYPAEGYHQEYYRKNPLRYQQYKRGSGREAYLNSGKH